MAKKSTKYRIKSKAARRAERRRQEKMVTTLLYIFLGVCVASFAAIGVSNSAGVKRDGIEWIVQEGEMEILAAPMANTMDRGTTPAGNQGGAALPFLQPTATPVPVIQPEPTLVALPTPMVTAVPDPVVPGLAPEEELPYVPITITAVGDCTLGGDVASGGYQNFQSYARQYGADYFFKNVRSLFEND